MCFIQEYADYLFPLVLSCNSFNFFPQQPSQGEARKVVDNLDKDGDGRIDLEEFRTMFQKK